MCSLSPFLITSVTTGRLPFYVTQVRQARSSHASKLNQSVPANTKGVLEHVCDISRYLKLRSKSAASTDSLTGCADKLLVWKTNSVTRSAGSCGVLLLSSYLEAEVFPQWSPILNGNGLRGWDLKLTLPTYLPTYLPASLVVN